LRGEDLPSEEPHPRPRPLQDIELERLPDDPTNPSQPRLAHEVARLPPWPLGAGGREVLVDGQPRMTSAGGCSASWRRVFRRDTTSHGSQRRTRVCADITNSWIVWQSVVVAKSQGHVADSRSKSASNPTSDYGGTVMERHVGGSRTGSSFEF
jgi:hypothetical protein